MSSTSRNTHFPLTISLILNVTSSFSFSSRSIVYLYSLSSLSIVSWSVSFVFFSCLCVLLKSIFSLIRIMAFLFGLSGLSLRPTFVWMAILKHAYLMSSSKSSLLLFAMEAWCKIILSSWACLSSVLSSFEGLCANLPSNWSFLRTGSRDLLAGLKRYPGGYSLLINSIALSSFFSIELTGSFASSRFMHALTK